MRLFALLLLTTAVVACVQTPNTMSTDDSTTAPVAITAPVAERRPHTITTHGHERSDPYFWLRDDDREDSDVIAYLAAENDYYEAVTQPLQTLEDALYEEMVARTPGDDAEPPVRIDDFWYYSEYAEGLEHPRYFRRPDGLKEAQLLLDPNIEAEKHDYYNAGGVSASDNHRLLAYAEDTLSRRIYTIRFKDLETNRYLDDEIPNTSGNFVWAGDNQSVFYVRRHPQTLLPYQVFRHVLGTPVEDDQLVYEEADDTFYTYVYRGASREWIYIHSGQTITDEVRLIPAANPAAKPKVFLPRQRGHEYSVDDANGVFYVLTNRDGAQNFKLMTTTLDDSDDPTAWKQRIAHRDQVYLHSVQPFNEYLVMAERIDGIRQLVVYPSDGDAFAVPADDGAYTMYLDANPSTDTNILRYQYHSPTTPDSILEFDMASGESTLLKRDEVVGGFEPEAFTAKRLMITARDGVKVPTTVVYRNEGPALSERPILVYGYGSYGSTIDPSFSLSQLSLLERDFVYAIAHIRGSQALGRQWYEDGKMFNKMNTFTDFIDVTHGLLDAGYGNRQRVYARGGSAGGLLMGAVANLSPQTYHGMIAAVPFVDVVSTMLDESIPLTTGEFDEWGNPKIPEQYEYILSYSPYDQVSAQDYPNLLVTTGLHDSQVQYWEPAKWVARLRHRKTDNNVLVMHTDLSAGHSGAAGRFQSYRDVARHYAFLIGLAEDQL